MHTMSDTNPNATTIASGEIFQSLPHAVFERDGSGRLSRADEGEATRQRHAR